MTENEYMKLHVLLEQVMEGNASEQEYVGLQNIILQNQDLQKYYFRYIELQAGPAVFSVEGIAYSVH